MKFGIDRLLADQSLRAELQGRRVALLAHPASVTENLTHSLDALAQCPEITLSSAFGPQHGLRGDKQDNMVESPDFIDPQLGIPIFSLYGEVRAPTDEMLDSFDVILVDLQDLGCRIYTFITTLRYILEAAAAKGKSVWVLDRPKQALVIAVLIGWLASRALDASDARRVAEVQATERGAELAAAAVTIAGLRLTIARYENADRAEKEIADAHEATDPTDPARANAGADAAAAIGGVMIFGGFVTFIVGRFMD